MAAEIISKQCSKCKQIKPLSEFNKDRSQKHDGYQRYCKICSLEYDKQYRQTEKGKEVNSRGTCKYTKTERGKAAQKRYKQSEKGRVNCRKNIKRYNICHPERHKARQAVTQAIKTGRLPKPESLQCLCCEPAKDYHHHKGYAPEHWLDVVPVCKKCHILCRQKVAC